MPGPDPKGLVSDTEAHGTVVQAYRPLAHGQGSLLHDPTVAAIGRRIAKSSAQVALTQPRFTREELELLPDEIEGITSGDDDELR